MTIPLLVHLVFHPRSTESRNLALAVHDALNSDPTTPGLRIPTTFLPELADASPPDCNLDQAEHSFVVVLVDATLHLDDPWCEWVGDLWERTRNDRRHRFLPIQLDEGTWPLDDRLKQTNFIRAVDLEDSVRIALVVREVVTALCRFIDAFTSGRAEADIGRPMTIFLSHTKIDLGVEPRVVIELKNALGPDQRNSAWFDSGDIDGGVSFVDAISQGIVDSSLLCVLTDNYASREWCRREVLLAKREQRPIVVVNALNSCEVRSFPYLGNVPVLRWNGNPQQPIDQLAKETLRVRHAQLVLDREKRDSDVLFMRPPELLTAHVADGSPILYPDPPLGQEESAMLEDWHVTAVTPLGRHAESTDLAGHRIALSMSPSNDIARFGFAEIHLRTAMLELSRYLLLRGATLVYGGHLGDESYTLALTELVRAHNELDNVPPVQRLVNYLPWPLTATDRIRSKYKSVAEIVPVLRPDGIDETLDPDFVPKPPTLFPASKSGKHRYAWARGMTDMRIKTARDPNIVARIVLGGPVGPVRVTAAHGNVEEHWYSSRVPGVLEEVHLAAQAEQPVFLVGAFGGVPALIADVLDNKVRPELTWEYQSGAPQASEMRSIYLSRNEEFTDCLDIVSDLKSRGFAGLNPHLSEQEHRELLTTRDTARIIELILAGLSRIQPTSPT